MKLSEVNYGDFVIWSESELVVLRITLDEAFIESAIKKATIFFKYGLLPKLLWKWYHQTTCMQCPISNSNSTSTSESTTASTSIIYHKYY